MNRSYWVNLFRDEDGPTAAEYAMMLVCVLVAIIGAVNAVGNSTAAGWGNNASKIQSASSAAGS